MRYLAGITTKKATDRCKEDMIIKQLPKDPFYRFFVSEGQFDLREIKFYTQVSHNSRDLFLFCMLDICRISNRAYVRTAVSGNARFDRVPSEEDKILE